MARHLVIVLLLVLGIAVAGILWLQQNLEPQAERLILAELARRGVTDASLQVVRLGLDGAEIEAIRLGSQDELRIERVSVDYSAEGLRQRRVDALRISGVRIRLGLGEQGLSFGSLDPLLASPAVSDAAAADAAAADEGEAPETAAPPPQLGDLLIEDIRVTLDVPVGTVVVVGRLEFAGGQLHLDARSEPFKVDANGTEVPVQALEIEMTAEPLKQPIPFEITLRDPTAGLVGRARGLHDLEAGSGELSFAFDPLHFEPEGLQPVTLLPLLTPWIRLAEGTLEARGAVRWKPGDTHSRVELAFSDFNLKSSAVDLGLLNGTVTMNGPWPLSTPAGQLFSMASVDFGLQLTNGLVRYRLHEDGSIELEHGRWGFAGGLIETEGRLNPAEDSNLLLRVSNVDLSELLELVPLDGLSGEGRLSGQLPVLLRGADVFIENGQLRGSEAGGWLRYRPDESVDAMGGGDEGFAVALGALENFHWTELELTLNGNTRDDTVVTFHIAGANPDYLDGHPVEFNLKLEAKLADLLRKSAASYEIPALIEKRLSEFVAGRKQGPE
ncbi:MAG: YdbH domain-containing protein [Myxococcales bacterium]|nr:YdbH domain-containing protein [Myxococcales bacterium]